MSVTVLASAPTDYLVAASTPWGILLIIGVAVVLPAVTDLATKRMTTGAVKSSVLLALSLVTGGLLELLAAMNAGTNFNIVTALITVALTFIVGVTSFFGLAQPLKVSGANGAIQKAVPAGVGSVDPDKVIISDNLVTGRHEAAV